jgi:hypothetical protein
MNLDHPMAILLILMTIAAPLGAIDVKYYHLWKFKLYREPSACWETVTHLIRGYLFAAGAYLIINFEFHGIWFWILGTLFIFDFVNEVADVILEPASRAPLGGIPKLEYLIHIIGATMGGAIATAYFTLGWRFQFLPNEIVHLHSTTFSPLLVIVIWVLIVAILILTTLEGFLFFKHWCFSKNT